jgi:hypothetical protein
MIPSRAKNSRKVANRHKMQLIVTWCHGIDESSDSSTVVPVRGEVVDRLVRDAGLDPVQQSLFRSLVGGRSPAELVAVPHRHRDRIVQDQRPHESEDQLHLAIDNIRTVCNTANGEVNMKQSS